MSVNLKLLTPHIAALEIDRPQVRNALDWHSMQAFAEAVEAAHQATDLRALIITGKSEAFCAGGDLKELSAYGTFADGERLARIMGEALARLESLPCPSIAAINGPARGGGAEIALACDLRVMGEDADLGLMHIRIGITPAWGGGQRLLRLVGYARALEWLATGHVLTAEEALACGLANRLTPAGTALEGAFELASVLAGRTASAVRAVKRLLQAGLSQTPAAAQRVEQAEFPPLWAAEEHHQLVAAFFNRARV